MEDSTKRYSKQGRHEDDRLQIERETREERKKKKKKRDGELVI